MSSDQTRIHPGSCNYVDAVLDLTLKKLKAQIIQVSTRKTSLCFTPQYQNKGVHLVPLPAGYRKTESSSYFPSIRRIHKLDVCRKKEDWDISSIKNVLLFYTQKYSNSHLHTTHCPKAQKYALKIKLELFKNL